MSYNRFLKGREEELRLEMGENSGAEKQHETEEGGKDE